MFKYYMELYSKMLENVAGYYRYSASVMEKFLQTYNYSFKNEKETKALLPTNGHDIYNYVARYGMSNLQIQAVMKLDGKLDFNKLNRAVKLSVDAEPVLKSRFVEDITPYWAPLDNINIVKFCTIVETDDSDKAIQDFIESSVDLDNDPMLSVKLIRTTDKDVIALKINHTCCDGTGVKEYLQLLADIYSSLDQEESKFVAIPRIAGRKDQDRMLNTLGITNPDSAFMPGSDIYHPTWLFPWEQSGSNISCMSVGRLPTGYINQIREYSKSKGATLNDYILAACYRAMNQIKQPVYGLPMEFPITIDLRRYLPDRKTMAIRNFSGSVNTKLAMEADEHFSETLQRISIMMKEIKQGYPGLQSALGLERLENISFADVLAYYRTVMDTKRIQEFCPLYCGDKCVPTLSNIGYVSDSLIKFGDRTVIDAYILPPVIRAPGLLLIAGTYNSVLTLAAGYYKSTVSSDNVDKLIDIIKQELIEGCKS